RRDGLGDFAHEEGLQVGFGGGRLQTDNRVSGLAGHEVALSVGAGYFKLADLALQSFGNVVGRNAVIEFHGDFLQCVTNCSLWCPLPSWGGGLIFMIGRSRMESRAGR